MGRSVVYCAVCGGPFESIYSTGDANEEVVNDVLPPSEVEVCTWVPGQWTYCSSLTPVF